MEQENLIKLIEEVATSNQASINNLHTTLSKDFKELHGYLLKVQELIIALQENVSVLNDKYIEVDSRLKQLEEKKQKESTEPTFTSTSTSSTERWERSSSINLSQQFH